MLTVYRAVDQKFLDQFISNTMTNWNINSYKSGHRGGWAFAQPDCGNVTFPAQFVIVQEPNIKLATIQILQ